MLVPINAIDNTNSHVHVPHVTLSRASKGATHCLSLNRCVPRCVQTSLPRMGEWNGGTRMLAMLVLCLACRSTSNPADLTDHSLAGVTLTMALPPTSVDPFFTYDGPPNQPTATWTGYVIEIQKQLAYSTGVTFVNVAKVPGAVYDMSVDYLTSGNTPPNTYSKQNQQAGLVPALPMISTNWGAVVTFAKKEPGLFQIFTPFSNQLWLSIVGVTLALGLGFVLIESRHHQSKPLSMDALVEGLYYSVTTLVGTDSDFAVRTVVGQWLRIALVFMCLIVNATYTANLVSILTASRAVYGVENMVELVGADHICVLEPSVHQDPSVKKYWPTHPNQTVVVSPRHGDPSKDACPTCTTARLR